MKNIFIILVPLLIFSCNGDNNPFESIDSEYKILIEPTGKSGNGLFEFRFRNVSAESAGYHAYSKSSPLYLTQVMTDTGWVNQIGWCGTGVSTYYLAPYESITVDILRPDNSLMWRVGLYTTCQSDESYEISWSAAQL